VTNRERFEAWHNEFYGPQSEFNLIRSLDYDDRIGYLDCTVQAQFCAFEGARLSTLKEASDIAEMYDMGTIEGHEIAGLILERGKS
jgi:hypothetical protein